MATTIDHKIVEMKFDNRDFERNARTSISTLEKLKSALHIKGSYDGLEKVSKAARNANVDVSGITSSLVTVTNSFSALEIVGIRTLVRLTDAAIDAGISIAKSMTVDQFAEGWKKMNQKVGSVQTLVNSTGLGIKEIDEYLSQLMWFSDETSYSFTDMTSALAQMTSTGGDIKKLVPMITGIANATAFAGKGAAEFSRVIYNLNQSYGAGYLQLMDWKSVQLAGANSKQLTEELIKAGEELGKIEKGTVTVGNFNDTLKDKWADTEVMELAFGRFAKLSEAAYQAVKEGKYDTASEAIRALANDYDDLSVKAFRSAQEAKSFKEAIDATADASSTTWMRIFSDIFGNYEQQKIMWTDFANTLWDTVVSPINDLEEIIRHAFNFEGFSALWDKISNNPVVDVMEDISDKVKSTTRTLEEYQDIVYKVWMGDYKNQPYRFPLLEEAGWNAKVVQELVNETEKISGYGKGYTVIDQITIDSVRKAEEKYGIAISEVVEVQEEQNELTKEQIDDIENLSEERLKALGLSEEEIRMYQSLQRAAKKYGLSINEIIDKMKNANGHDLLFGRTAIDENGEQYYEFNGVAQNIWAVLENIAGAAKKAWSEVFNPFGGAELYMILDNIYKFSVRLKEISENERGLKNLKNTFKGLFAILKIVTSFVGGVGKVVWVVFKAVLQGLGMTVLEFTGFVGDALARFVEWVEENNILIEGIKWLTEKIVEISKSIYEWFRANVKINISLDKLKEKLDNAKKALLGWWQGAKDAKAAGKLSEYLINTFVNAFEKIKVFCKDKFGNVIDWLSETFKNSSGKVGEWFKGLPLAKEAGKLGTYLIDGLMQGLSYGGNKLIEGISWVANIILETFKRIFKIHSPSQVMEEQGENVMAGLYNGVKNFAGYFYELFKAILDKVIDIIKNVDIGSILVAALTGSMVYVFIKIAGAITILANGLNDLNYIIYEFGDTLQAFQGTLRSVRYKLIGSAVKDLAISIAILAASVWLLTKLDTGKMFIAVGAIASLALILVALTALAGKFGKKNAMEFGKLALTVLAIGVAMSMMASALKKISKISGTSLTSLIAFGGMLLAFIAIMLIISKSNANIVKVAGTLLAIGIVFKLMASVVKTLGKLEPGQIIKGTLALVAFAGIIVGLMAATKLLTGSKNVEKIGISLLAISAAFYIMARVVKLLGKMEPSDLAKGMACITVLSGIIVGLMAATRLTAGGKNIDKVGKSIAAIAGAFTMMGITVRLLGGMKVADLAKGIVAVSLFTGMIMGLMIFMKSMGIRTVENIGKTMLGIAAAIGVMALSAALLSIISLPNLAKGITAVGLLSLFVMGLVKATSTAHDVYKSLIVMTVAIGVFALAIGLLSLIDAERLIGPVVAMGILMGMFALMEHEAKNIKASTLKQLAVMVGAIALIAGIVVGLSFINAESAIKSAIAVGVLLTTMSLSLAILDKVGPNVKNALLGALGLAGLLVVLLGLVGILQLMSGIQNADKNAMVLATFLGALTVVLILVTVVGLLYTATAGLAATGLLGLAGLLVVLLGVIGVLALMNNIQNVESNINTLINIMNVMTEMLFKIGVIGPLALIGVSALGGLITLMGVLLTFSIAIGALITYLPSIKTFIDNGLSLLISLAGGLGEMLGAFVGGILTQVSSSLPVIGMNLSQFMINMLPFITTVKLVDKKVLEGVGILSASVLLLTAAQLISAIGTFLSGGSGFAELGKELSSFMINALPFFTIASTLNDKMLSGIKSLSGAILSLTAAELLQGITNFITGGGSSLGEFGKQLPELGTHLSEFAVNLGEFSEGQVSTVECAGKAISALADAASKLPNEGGWVAKILGDNSLASFGDSLPTIGTKIREFVDNLGEFSEGQVSTTECACKVITAIADAAKKIPNEDGLWAKIFGDNSLKKFADSMPDVAKGVKGFISELGEFGDKTDSVNSAANVIKSLADLGKLDLNKAKDNLPKFSEGLIKFGNNLKSFIENISGIAKEKMELASSNLKIIIDAVLELIKVIKDTTTKNTDTVVTAFEDVGVKSAKAINSKSVTDELKKQGLNFVTGFATSIKNNSNISTEAAKSMATKALTAIKEVQNSHSPSKETMKLGSYFGEGFVIGIEQYATKVYDVSSEVGNMAKNGLSTAISKMSSLVDSGINTQPTIRPVLDLSDIENGVGRIDSMFGNPTLDVVSNLNSISRGVNERIQNGGNSDVISAINKLGKSLGNASGDTYNINGITYDDQSSVSDAVQTLIRAINIERRS